MPTIAKPISSAQETHPKLDPRLAALVELDDRVFEPADPGAAGAPDMRRGGAESHKVVQRRAGPLAFLTGPQRWAGDFDVRHGHEAMRVSHVPVFVTASDPGALDEIALRAGGLVWRSRAGRMATTDVNLGQLGALEEDSRVLAIEWTGGAKPQGESGGARGVPPRRAVGLDPEAPAEFDGSGVVVGIIDIEGIDIYHPDFSTPDGRPRVEAIWDQTEAAPRGRLGELLEPYGYGVKYTREDIWIELNPSYRVRYAQVGHTPLKISHGTRVAGVAAGGGTEDPETRGVAPSSEIVFVNTLASGAGALAAMTEIAEAVDFVFREAGERPCVANVSLGDELGPHDGTSPVERFFDEMLAERSGRAIVIAAGNSHEKKKHVAGSLSGSGSAAVFFCDSPAPSERNAVIEIWYDSVADTDAGIGVQLVSPDESEATPVVAAEGLPQAFDLGATRVLIASMRCYPASCNAVIRIEMFPRERDGRLDVGSFQIRLLNGTGSHIYHAWLDHPSFTLRAEPTQGDAPSPVTITSPGTCRSAITVGACSDSSDEPVTFTGCGPGRHGIDKPDVLACGVALRAPSAATTNRSHPAFTGTSAAAPVVAGVVALAFQHALRRGVRLTAEQTRAFVCAAAARRGLPVPGSAPAERDGGSAGSSASVWPPRLRLPRDGRLDAIFSAAKISLLDPE
ncbi:S8 family serine peptidase [Sorangium sp. So ce269]